MDDVRLANGLRSARIRRGWRQVDLARRSRASRSTISRLEQGRTDGITIGTFRAVARALDLQVTVSLRWRGSELDRLLDAAHASMQDETIRLFERAGGWEAVPEVSFSVFGERGIIDILGWHAATRSLLVVELKTLLVDVGGLLGTMDRRRRLAIGIGAERGWRASTVGTWVVLGATRTNRRRAEAHCATVRAAFPAGGPEIRRWLRSPAGTIDALSFLSYDRQERTTGGRLRVRPRASGHTPS